MIYCNNFCKWKIYPTQHNKKINKINQNKNNKEYIYIHENEKFSDL
jgi:hypothetical protein